MPWQTLPTSQVAHQAGAYPGFCSMKRLGVFLLPPGWDASPSQGCPSIKFTGTHLFTWVERDTVRVKCLAQEHNTMSPARARTFLDHSLRSSTAPPTLTVPRFTIGHFQVSILPLCQNKSTCETIDAKMSSALRFTFMQIKLTFI